MSWPKLSETLTSTRHPGICQSCGQGLITAQIGPPFIRWIECDEHDRGTHVAVVLCADSSKRLIDPHPRLYRATNWAEAVPGCMELCIACRHRAGVICRHPSQKHLGGAGLAISQPRPRGIACSRGKGGGCRPFYDPGDRPSACAGFAESSAPTMDWPEPKPPADPTVPGKEGP